MSRGRRSYRRSAWREPHASRGEGDVCRYHVRAASPGSSEAVLTSGSIAVRRRLTETMKWDGVCDSHRGDRAQAKQTL